MNLFEQAQMFATQKHVLDNRQLYGNVLPYTHHLMDVVEVVRRYLMMPDETMEVAAILHDVVEDTRERANEVKIRDIEEMFGEEVAKLVDAVSTPNGPDRKTRNLLAYPRIREAGLGAVRLKLADRIANVEHGGRISRKYREEYPGFRHGLGPVPTESQDPITFRMWAHLDTLMRFAP